MTDSPTDSSLVKVPLVSVSVEDLGSDELLVKFFVDDVTITSLSLLKKYVPINPSQPLPLMFLTQLLVTPHEHLAVLSDLVSFATGGQTTGDLWDEAVNRGVMLLNPPQPPSNKE